MRRIRKFTVETERTFIFRNHSRQIRWCAECDAEVEMACVDAAASEAGVSELDIYQLVELRALHFAETSDGRVLVCLNSLRQ